MSDIFYVYNCNLHKSTQFELYEEALTALQNDTSLDEIKLFTRVKTNPYKGCYYDYEVLHIKTNNILTNLK